MGVIVDRSAKNKIFSEKNIEERAVFSDIRILTGFCPLTDVYFNNM